MVEAYLRKLGITEASIELGRAVRQFIVVGVVLGLSFLLSPETAEMDFYAASSQILPVLVLVLMLEARWFGRRLRVIHAGPLGVLTRGLLFANQLIILLNLIAAEWAALAPLASGDAAGASPRPVVAGLAVTTAVLCMLAMTPRDRTPPRVQTEDGR